MSRLRRSTNKYINGLCLTRRVGESVIIAGELKVHVGGIKGGYVQLVFEDLGDKKTTVDRSEIFESKSREPFPF